MWSLDRILVESNFVSNDAVRFRKVSQKGFGTDRGGPASDLILKVIHLGYI